MSVDPTTNLILVKGLPGPTLSQSFTLTVTGTTPDGLSASFDFILNMTPCKTTPLVLPIMVDQSYYVYDPLA